jgi:dTDP-4-dehydrorhamnose reductase
MKKYLLTGGSGTLGTELQKHLDCWAPSRELLDVTTSANDIARSSVNRKIYDVDEIIHCAGYTDVPGAEIYKKEAIEVNITGTKNIAKLSRLYGKKIIYISTDYVYAGIGGGYREIDRPEPFNFYGFTKLAGEAYVDLDTDLVIRTSFKPSDLWNTKFDKAFIDIYTSADYVDIVARDISLAIEGGFTGVVNIGTERKSVYELAKRRNPNVGQLSRLRINCPMPRDISMRTEKFRELKKSLEDSDEQ